MTQRELQNLVLTILPTYRSELRALEGRLIAAGQVDYRFVGEAFMRPGLHIFGKAPEGHALAEADTFVPIDYIPCDHHLYVLRDVRPTEDTEELPVRGHESCPLCGKPIPIELRIPLTTRDLVLVGCPVLKEGEVVIDVLPVFSATLVAGALSSALNIPYQRSKNAMTRVSALL